MGAVSALDGVLPGALEITRTPSDKTEMLGCLENDASGACILGVALGGPRGVFDRSKQSPTDSTVMTSGCYASKLSIGLVIS